MESVDDVRQKSRNGKRPFAGRCEEHRSDQLVMKIRFLEDRLGRDRVYPCTLAEIRRRLADLDAAHVEPVSSIRLCNLHEHRGIAVAYQHSGQIRFFAFPRHRFWYLGSGESSPPTLDAVSYEWLDWGARLQSSMDGDTRHWWLHWPIKSLRNYALNHLLLHEIGHLVAKHRYSTVDQKENFAERFAVEIGGHFKPKR